ncbi:MAG TPA: 3-beta hydroxysteroid dehydrogenase, partial [Flavisolibacter sp.]|nr:3-beta hydroxysteroid dehydrogenase [Flavisolibacter sp.]
LALEQDFEPGTRFHGVAEEGIPFRAIAEVIGRRLNLPVKSLTKEEASAHFTWFTHFAGMDSQSSSKQTRERLKWQPREIGLLDDVDQPYYFN